MATQSPRHPNRVVLDHSNRAHNQRTYPFHLCCLILSFLLILNNASLQSVGIGVTAISADSSSTNIRRTATDTTFMNLNSRVFKTAFLSHTAVMRRASGESTAIFGSSESATSDSKSKKNEATIIRILCLHGKGGNGKSFINSSLAPLRTLLDKRLSSHQNLDQSCVLSFQWEEVTAPFQIDPNSDKGGYSWWTMPPGVRSFDAEEYEGFDKSASKVLDTIFSNTNEYNSPNDTCNFDIVFGHSQGAILTAALLSADDKFLECSPALPRGYILNGAAWPNPFGNSLVSLSKKRLSVTTEDAPTDKDISEMPRMLFIMGKEDTINPIESAKQVHDAYNGAGFGVSIVNHDGGHSVPFGQDEDSTRALEEVVDWIMAIALKKAATLTKENCE